MLKVTNGYKAVTFVSKPLHIVLFFSATLLKNLNKLVFICKYDIINHLISGGILWTF